jgi:hypothetical protein
MADRSFTLLRKTVHGWTDQHGDVSAEFATEAEARNASIELNNAWGHLNEWHIVPTADLGNYDLVA